MKLDRNEKLFRKNRGNNSYFISTFEVGKRACTKICKLVFLSRISQKDHANTSKEHHGLHHNLTYQRKHTSLLKID